MQVSDPAQADIQVGYGNCSSQGLLGECIWSYNPATDTYNNALVLLQNPAISPLSPDSSGNLTYSGTVTWLQQVAAHEFGAALGLAEGSEPNSILNHVLRTSNRVPDAADVAAIDHLYGTPATVSADTLSLVLSEDYWRGNAQFIVKVDGQKVGGPTAVTALRSADATEAFNYTGDWGSGAHTVEVDFINDAYGGSPTMDRNLYVDQVTFDGKAELSSPHALYSDGEFVLHVQRAIGLP